MSSANSDSFHLPSLAKEESSPFPNGFPLFQSRDPDWSGLPRNRPIGPDTMPAQTNLISLIVIYPLPIICPYSCRNLCHILYFLDLVSVLYDTSQLKGVPFPLHKMCVSAGRAHLTIPCFLFLAIFLFAPLPPSCQFPVISFIASGC